MAASRAKKSLGPDRVLCVSPHKASGGWQIAYVRGGKRRTEQRATEEAANKRAAKLQISLAGPHEAGEKPAAAQPGRATGAAGWAELLWGLSIKAVKEPGNDELQRVLRCVSSAASAAAKHLDTEADRARITALEKAREKEIAARAARQLADADSHEQAGPDRQA